MGGGAAMIRAITAMNYFDGAALNRDAFKKLATAAVGGVGGWQTRTADALGINPRQIRRWLATDDAPEWVADKLMGIAGAKLKPLREEWLLCAGLPSAAGHQRRYVLRLVPPKFIARVVGVDRHGHPHAEEMPVNVSNDVVRMKGMVLCELIWFDTPELLDLETALESAAEILAKSL